jgi:phosphoglycerate dehydrogenase-like enzyme
VNRLVLDLEDRRPIWAMPDWAMEELRGALPADWEIHVVPSAVDGSGDGGRIPPSAEVLRAVADARVYIGFGIPTEVLAAGAETLEWVHSGAAGVGGSLHDTMLKSRVCFTNSAGVHAPPMAETVLAMILHFTRGLDFAVEGQRAGGWNDAPFLAIDTPVRELAATTVGIFGYGGIGREVGWRLAALGSRVIGLGRSAPEGPVDTHGVERVHGEEGLAALLEESGVLVIAAPETPQTRSFFDLERLRALRRGSILVNVARGRIVDEEALVQVLREGHLRGAALDVFATEPLPAGHPLWDAPNTLLTPHVSGVTRGFWRREMDLVLENLRRFLEGRSLLNEVDRTRGY